MKKYLISIEKEDSSRLADFFSQSTFGNYKSEFKKVGVIGAQLPTAEYFKLAVAGRKKPLSPAELGCTLSHVNALKDFLASNEKYACIFEDDAICLNSFDLNTLETQVDQLNLNPCFFFSLGGIQLKSCKRVRGYTLDQKINGTQILKLHPLYFGRLFYTYAYIVDRKMAELLLKYHEVPKGCDHWSQIREYNPDSHFYATFLFDHPELDDISLTSQSHIQLERKSMQIEKKIKKSILTRWKISILKKLYKFLLDKYSV